MKERMDYSSAAPVLMKALNGLQSAVDHSSLEGSLLELVRIRASQINGCAYCLDMHTKDARAKGESEMRIYTLSAWRETPFFSDRERAALEWTETLTLIATDKVSDDLFERTRQHFTETELAELSGAIIMINAWNRLAIPFRDVPGVYQPKKAVAAV
ncbi:MAG: carboxymuconolactone decarboxylase family protein [Chloroflexota bacterium]